MPHIFDHQFFGENRGQSCSQYSRRGQTRNLYSSFSSYLINSYPSICFLDCCSAMSWCFNQIPCNNPESFFWGVAVSSEPIAMCMMLGVLPLRLITCICLHWISSVILSLSVPRSRCGLVPSAFPSSSVSPETLAMSPPTPTPTSLMKLLSTDPCSDLHGTPHLIAPVQTDHPSLAFVVSVYKPLRYFFHGSLLPSKCFDEGFCQSL